MTPNITKKPLSLVYYPILSAYPELFALVGGTVPDFRGLFLRGHGAQASNHYGIVTHQSAGLGQLQGDAIRNITGHMIKTFKARGFDHSISGAFEADSGTGGSYDADGYGPSGFTFDASRVVPTANENRPVNMAVRYFIRAKS